METGMPEESKDEIRTSAEASKAAIDLSAEVADADGRSIA
jgi:tellurite resistance protein